VATNNTRMKSNRFWRCPDNNVVAKRGCDIATMAAAAFFAVQIFAVVFPRTVYANDTALHTMQALSQAGFAVADGSGKLLQNKQPDSAFVPASTTKLITAWLALRYWGEAHRFATSIYYERNTATLWIKAGGDPFLISEELKLMARQIAELEIDAIDSIALDVSLFEPNLVVPGATVTTNPYDAVPTAIAANFNTLNLRKDGDAVISAELQTPLTPYSLSFASVIGETDMRINTGRVSRNSEQYFAELLAAFLRLEGLAVADNVQWGSFPDVKADFVYRNSRTLGDVLQLMLRYSTNFIANQLMLTLVAEVFQQPANFNLVAASMTGELVERFGWSNIHFEEGAGLSAENRISSRQLVELLATMKPWMHLLPEVKPGVIAKTGSLTDVETLAGYLVQKNGRTQTFAIMINEKVPSRLAVEVAVELVAD